MKKSLCRVLLLLVAIGIGVGIAVYRGGISPVRGTSQAFVMGSLLEQSVWTKGAKTALTYRISDTADAIRALEKTLTAGPLPADDPVQVLCDALTQKTSGAFRSDLGELIDLWGIDQANRTPSVPSDEDIQRALAGHGKANYGAVGKGAACDAALAVSKDANLRGFVVSVGGNIVTFGNKPFGQPFKVALRDPKGALNDSIGVFTLKGTCFVSTSGSYEKYFEQDGKRYHHILDGRTGYPAETNGLISVTVLSNNGAVGDALSTACFLVGYNDAQSLLDDYDCEAIFIYDSGAVRATGSAKERFELRSEAYHWAD
ncbi:MAG: FAD:protein FMN transferase [Oscillospiraceae bacterium]|jgi:thiamine biosynthesis lipoprotein ApbE|nr:FAD:protein FMN transferase [Oscillospiraceae bacterium]